MDGTILVADDDRTIRTVLTQALTRAGCKVHATSSLTTLMRWIGEGMGDAVICDVMMPDGNGLEMLPKIQSDRPGLPVIVISAQNTIMTAIQATKADAYDYLPKPFDLPDLMKRCARALENRVRAPVSSRSAAPAPETLPMIGKTPAMQDLYRLVARVMNADLPALITGESGTGKSLIARALHDYSDRRNLPFVATSEADLSEVDGPARLLARVRGGTLLLDEIADLDEEIQGRIVRMMEAPEEYAPRFIAASRFDPGVLIAQNKVRQDLFYRLNGATITVPPLRDRVEDIALLCTYFLERTAHDSGTPMRHLSAQAAELMRAYSWPGNVRQLEKTVRGLGLTAHGEEITRFEVEIALSSQPQSEEMLRGSEAGSLSDSVARHLRRYFDLHGGDLPPAGLYGRILREIEAPLIEIALDATAGNQAKCADLLGINRNTLRKKITDLDICVTRRRKLM